MKANELRIGNYVSYRGEIDCIVSNIGSYGFETIKDDDINNLYGSSCLDDYSPIPLTEQSLLDFGFVTLDFEQDYVEWGNPDGIECFKFHLQQDGIGKPKEYPFYFRYDVGFGEQQIEIRYVHQLQNIYYTLTGEELTQTTGGNLISS